ncbi:hypothetical protein EJ06DRAFT_584508 [Trichodelitschia bisporula]|uniref:C2H2-type domain-containing protein n=1 Tax=Trichodelitschia bisporula TaxID=703511 RepID=A0A6G1HNV9_9PEZI|nr:hypothetical protein EJ06DRAFT_584508 [Trichodelitschia bisporula]
MADSTADGNKGKGKAKEVNEDTEPISQHGQSLASRVISSASGLAQNALQGGSHVPRAISSSFATADKSQSTGQPSEQSAWFDAAVVRPGPAINGANSGQAGIHSTGESFRTRGDESSTRRDLESFLTGEGNGLPNGGTGHSSSPWTAEFDTVNLAHPAKASQTNLAAKFNGFQHPDNYDDGAEVRQLLSDPSFTAHTDDFDMMEMEKHSNANIADLFPQTFSQEEQPFVSKIKSAMPETPVHGQVPSNHPLNLRPLSDAEQEALRQQMQNLDATLGDSTSNMYSSADPQENWLSEWQGVLNSYTDEVWGDALPFVQEARSQLEVIQSGTGAIDSKAITRLKMILSHVSQQAGLPTADQIQAATSNGIHEETEDKNMAAPKFHCPWISCHQRFHNEWELHLHSNTHKYFSCPHISCTATFAGRDEWAEHISIAHHDLVDTRIHTPSGDKE